MQIYNVFYTIPRRLMNVITVSSLHARLLLFFRPSVVRGVSIAVAETVAATPNVYYIQITL